MFNSCYSLLSVTVPIGVETIEESAFFDCRTLESVIIPESVVSIGESAFCWCRNMKNVSMGNGVKYIGEFAFSHCDELETMVLGNNVVQIANSAFRSCTSLVEIVIPKTLLIVEDYTFKDSYRIRYVNYCGSEEEYNRIFFGFGNDELLYANWTYNYGTEPEYAKGDINGDEDINAVDLSLLKKLLAGIITLNNEEIKNVEVDENSGAPNASDLAQLKKMLVGLA